MSENNSSSSSLPIGIGLASLIGFFTLGPIDFPRTAYNAVVGDIPLIRSELVEYSRRNIGRENPTYNKEQVEKTLARDLNYNLKEGAEVDSQKVRMMELWDASEDHASNWYHQWVWPNLKD